MTRREFSKKTKVQAFQRANGFCEGGDCSARLQVGHYEYDHRIAAAFDGEPTLENCVVLCRSCHAAKTFKQDIPAIAKSNRTRARHVGAHQSRSPMPCGKKSKFKKLFGGRVVLRERG